MQRVKKVFGKYKEPLAPMPNLVEGQVASFEWLKKFGLGEIFKEFAGIKDYSGKKFELSFTDFKLEEPKYDESYAKENKMNFEAPLKAMIRLTNKIIGSTKEQEIFMADFPMMTKNGTFIINGIERVIVPQLARSFGIFFTENEVRGKRYFGAKVIPSRGAWMEIETEADDVVYVRIDKNRKFAISTLLRAMGAATDDEILALGKGNPELKHALEVTLAKDVIKTQDEAFIEIYKRLRDGDLATVENARDFFKSIFEAERYDLSRVGRFRFNKRFSKSLEDKDLERKTLSLEDIAITIAHAVSLNHTVDAIPDDIDHMGSRRVRFVGEMIQQKVRVGMTQMKRNIQNRMSTIDTDAVLPVQFISPRPLQARIKEFFTTNQLSQFMQQENALAELEHMRTISALGPGGLSRERAGFEVRDVHPSHYGRVCPIHTPEGQNIGLILRFSTYAKVNNFGMIETPYAKVKNGKVTEEIQYLNALEEEKYNIAHAAIDYDKEGKIKEKEIEVRQNGKPVIVPVSDVHYMDVSTNQPFAITTSMIPFLNHDDANRSLMGSNMQKQAVPCLVPDAPLVGTGIEEKAIADTGRVIAAETDGVITHVDGRKITVKDAKGQEHSHTLVQFQRTNGFTVFHQRPVVDIGQKVKKGEVIADMSVSDGGQMALGQNLRVGFMTWSGNNYEDAIILSEKLVKDQKLTSIHMEEFVVNVRDTKLGPEVTTCDIPNVGELKLRNLDEDGIIRIGAEVRPGDILVGKVTPKGETQLTPEERLLRSIFGEKAKDVKDTSKRLEGGKRGRIVNVKIFSRERGDKLESGIIKRIHIEIAQLRNISVGDKLAGRHGNKGVISRILPIEDMPYDADGTSLDVILTPLGVPSRMNLGQILELHLGMAAHKLNYQAIVPPFAGATDAEIKEELIKAGMPADGKIQMYDGRTGEAFEQKTAVGYMYILKLHHMVEDKIHMRSIGPYSLITQQPLGGKAQNGGQRFGEMEVWALLGYGASYTLREMLTYKSDDIVGRSDAFDSIVKGERIEQPNIPASFHVMLNTLRGLSLDVDLKLGDQIVERSKKRTAEDMQSLNY
jgi:DNA-directed RNA polymerase subunit beta